MLADQIIRSYATPPPDVTTKSREKKKAES